ncbi:NADH-quinone oxidoreductase subunit N [bacterium]|nr:NADH-quinone oxidoreductase subunit N [bacterium]
MGLYAAQLECLLVLLALVTLLTDAFRPVADKRRLGHVLAALVGITFLYSFLLQPLDQPVFHGLYRLDALALFGKRLFLLATAYVLVMGAAFTERFEGSAAEFYVLVLLAATGMLLIAAVNDFVLLFVALELVTISFYVLAGFLRRHVPSLEAGTKYLILGALSSGFTVYGIAYIFGTTGTTNFSTLYAQLSASNPAFGAGAAAQLPGAFKLGVVLVLTGLGFKIASVPFQVWVPDVYQGAPTPVTAFLAVGSKAAGFFLVLRVLFAGLLPAQAIWVGLIPVLAAATLLYGNLGAIPQRNIKRLLGYSSIGHAGYLLLGVAAGTPFGLAAVLFYLVQYAVTNLCGFLVIVAVSGATGTDDISSYAGLGKRSPLLGVGLFLALASLAGLPPLSGFFGKFQLFAAVIERAATDGRYYLLAAVGAIGVVVSLYYYFNVARAIYLEEPATDAPIPVHPVTRVALVIGLAIIVVLGVYPGPLVTAAEQAVRVLPLR